MVLDWYNVSIQRIFKFCLEKLEKRYEEMNYKKRRDEVLSKMEKNSVLVLYSGVRHHVSADEYDLFTAQANRNFFYLTGLRRDNMVLVLDKCVEPAKTMLDQCKLGFSRNTVVFFKLLQFKWQQEQLHFFERSAERYQLSAQHQRAGQRALHGL